MTVFRNSRYGCRPQRYVCWRCVFPVLEFFSYPRCSLIPVCSIFSRILPGYFVCVHPMKVYTVEHSVYVIFSFRFFPDHFLLLLKNITLCHLHTICYTVALYHTVVSDNHFYVRFVNGYEILYLLRFYVLSRFS